eukprot:NODE_273_length_1552_cov_266.360612_g197_i0.p1 GENE.NODE_273_length_1552_cov_266.360612_g197_i0~~NODE_273_length_1552_cov_266.360612_g197_i0.p1  ORF type:complete len:491 (-),score=126.84 NODE_273_length_1552_cov_266.360612_g197_i0:79-1356(-)
MEVSQDVFIPADLSRLIFDTARDLNAESDDEEAKEEAELEYSETQSVRSVLTDAISMPDMEELDPDEERILDEMMPQNFVQTRNLADLIMEKIRQKEHAKETEGKEKGIDEDLESRPEDKFDPKVKSVYAAVGRVMSKMKSGRLPKAMKILPHLDDWEELLILTSPHKWTSRAMREATKVFVSNLNEKMAQRFHNAVLLPCVRHMIKHERKIDQELYMAVRKATFKQKAFMKGFLLPLLEEGCTMREAYVLGRLVAKTSFTPVQAAVTIAKIALMPYTGGTSFFLRVLFEKKYQLPMAAVDAVVQHYGSFLQPGSGPPVMSSGSVVGGAGLSFPGVPAGSVAGGAGVGAKGARFPVLWHQSLLSFLQNYKHSLTWEQVLLLQKVANKYNHFLITPEIRKELMPLINQHQKEEAVKAKRAAMAASS